MPESAGAAEVAHTDDKLGLHPVRFPSTERRQGRPVGREARELLAEAFAEALAEGDERAAGEAQAVGGLLRQERDRRAAPLVDRGTDQDQVALRPALDLAPAVGAALR